MDVLTIPPRGDPTRTYNFAHNSSPRLGAEPNYHWVCLKEVSNPTLLLPGLFRVTMNLNKEVVHRRVHGVDLILTLQEPSERVSKDFGKLSVDAEPKKPRRSYLHSPAPLTAGAVKPPSSGR